MESTEKLSERNARYERRKVSVASIDIVHGSQAYVDVLMEALNVFNHDAFAFFAQDINSAQFGKITNVASTPRQLQLGLRVKF